MAGEKYTNIGKARWENANVGVIKWDPENKAGLASVIDETTGTVYEIGGGGSGESDYSTAQVTVTVPTYTYSLLKVPYIDNNMLYAGLELYKEAEGDEYTTTITVVLFNDTLVLQPGEMGDYTNLSGDIAFDEAEGYYLITGDCSFKIEIRQ